MSERALALGFASDEQIEAFARRFAQLFLGLEAPAGLPPYSGADITCPKCGDEMVMTIYVASADDAPYLWRREFDGLDYPLMRRSCACCGYAWAEVPLEHPNVARANEIGRVADRLFVSGMLDAELARRKAE